jgi:uncharacterized protein YggT (Ycf19 family)
MSRFFLLFILIGGSLAIMNSLSVPVYDSWPADFWAAYTDKMNDLVKLLTDLIEFPVLVLLHFFPGFTSTINFTLRILYYFVRLLTLIIMLRFTLWWFPNINPYIQPFYIITYTTAPLFDWVDKIFPKVFGFDPSLIVVSTALEHLLRYLDTLRFEDIEIG